MPPSPSAPTSKKAAAKTTAAPAAEAPEVPEVTEAAPAESSLSDAAKALAAEALAAAEAEQQAAGADPAADQAADQAPEDETSEPPVDPTKEVAPPAVATLTAPDPAPEPEPEEKFTATLLEAAIERVGLADGFTLLRDFRGERLDPAAVFSNIEEGGNVRTLVRVVVETTATEYNRRVRTQLLAPNAFVSVAEARAVREQIVASNQLEDRLRAVLEELGES